MNWALLAFTAYRRARARKGLLAVGAAGVLALGAVGTPAVMAQHQGCQLTVTASQPLLVDHVQVFETVGVEANTGYPRSRIMADAMMPGAGSVSFVLPCGDYTIVPFPSEQDLADAWAALPMPRQVRLDHDRGVSVDP